jgi:hypothetical protein
MAELRDQTLRESLSAHGPVDSLDLVSVWVKDKCGIVVRIVFEAYTGLASVASTARQSCGVERVHSCTTWSDKGDMSSIADARRAALIEWVD